MGEYFFKNGFNVSRFIESMIRFSIVIVTYNSEKYIKACLESIFRQDFNNYEVVLIDNASRDKTLSVADSLKASLKIRIENKNTGFSAAVNKGITLSSGEYILTLNPDVTLKDNFLSRINKDIDSFDENTGMVGVKILKAGAENIIDSTGLVLSKAIRFFDRGSGKKDNGQYDRYRKILGPCAAAAVYKKEMLEDIRIDGEYFDKDFFYLLEDFDIALRARKKGWKAIYMPEAVCYHERNGSGVRQNYRQYMTFRNRYFLMIKDIDIGLKSLFFILCYDIPRFIFLLMTNIRTVRAILEIGIALTTMLSKRKAIDNI